MSEENKEKGGGSSPVRAAMAALAVAIAVALGISITALSVKADRADMEALEAALATKAEAANVAAALSAKADNADMEALEASMVTKVDKADMEALAQALSAKADRAEVAKATKALSRRIDRKVDAVWTDLALRGQEDQKLRKRIAELHPPAEGGGHAAADAAPAGGTVTVQVTDATEAPAPATQDFVLRAEIPVQCAEGTCTIGAK